MLSCQILSALRVLLPALSSCALRIAPKRPQKKKPKKEPGQPKEATEGKARRATKAISDLLDAHVIAPGEGVLSLRYWPGRVAYADSDAVEPGLKEAALLVADILPDGCVHWQGQTFTSLSTFSLAAKNHVRRMAGIHPPLAADNGWGCVWYKQPGDEGDGKLLCDVWDEWKGALENRGWRALQLLLLFWTACAATGAFLPLAPAWHVKHDAS